MKPATPATPATLTMPTDVVKEVTKSNFFHTNRFSILATNNDSNDNSDNGENNGSGNGNGLYNVKDDNGINSGDVGNNNNDKEFKCELKGFGRMYNNDEHNTDVQRFSRATWICPKCFIK